MHTLRPDHIIYVFLIPVDNNVYCVESEIDDEVTIDAVPSPDIEVEIVETGTT